MNVISLLHLFPTKKKCEPMQKHDSQIGLKIPRLSLLSCSLQECALLGQRKV